MSLASELESSPARQAASKDTRAARTTERSEPMLSIRRTNPWLRTEILFMSLILTTVGGETSIAGDIIKMIPDVGIACEDSADLMGDHIKRFSMDVSHCFRMLYVSSHVAFEMLGNAGVISEITMS